MNVWQVARQLKKLLEGATWGDSPGQAILGAVVVSKDASANFLPGHPEGAPALALPFARIDVVDAPFEAHPLGRTELTVLVHVVAGGTGRATRGTGNIAAADVDPHGEASLLGGTRATVAGQGKSTGRAVDEIAAELLTRALGTSSLPGRLVDSTHGLQGRAHGFGPVEPVDGLEVVERIITFTVLATAARTYHEPFAFGGTGAAGVVSLTWQNPPARYDSLGLLLLRKAGSTPPSGPTDGTATTVALGSAYPTSFSDSPGVGTWSYALFDSLDETTETPTTADRYSAGATLTVTA